MGREDDAAHVGGETMSLAKPSAPVRSIRVAGLLAILFGVSGILTGAAAAGTFIPYRQGEPWTEFAEIMTVIAAVGAAISVVGVLTGRGLRRADVWACWPVTLGVAATCVALNLLMTVYMGLGYLWFVAVVAAAYGAEIVLLLMGRKSYRAQMRTAASA